MGKRAFGWAADKGGCYFYRLAMPLEEMAKTDGWAVAHDTRFPGLPKIPPDHPRLPKITAEEAAKWDMVIAQRTSQPAASIFWNMLAKTSVLRVYETDDDLAAISAHSNPVGHQFFSKPEIKENIRRNITSADLVTVSTPRLAEIAAELNPRVFVCPNAIPDWLPDLKRSRPDQLTVGWAGSATHEMDFAEVSDALRQVFRRRTHAGFHAIGTNYAARLRLPSAQSRYTPWVKSTPDYYAHLDFDIGIAPLRPHIFNQSKSYIKALEYAAMGIPVVASKVGPYPDFVRHGETGFLVKYPHEWAKYLTLLIDDPDMREEMGRNARELSRSYTITALLPFWKEAWSSCR